MADKKRSHSKVAKLPEEIRAAVDRKIMAGVEYQEIADYINAMGTEVSRSSVNRYGQRFMDKMERLRMAREQARIVVETAKDGPALEMVEAANQMAVQVILERLIDMGDIKEAKSTEVLKALALLERSAVQREKLMLEYNRALTAATKQIKDGLQKELGKQPELLTKLLSMVDTVLEEVKQAQK